MKLSEFEYSLPERLIAQKPATPRSSSKLMVLDGNEMRHEKFYGIKNYVEKGDVIVVNDSKVIPARLFGRKRTGGKVEALLLRSAVGTTQWRCLLKGKNLQVGTEIRFGRLRGTITGKENGKFEVEFSAPVESFVARYGKMPLPPYIKAKIPSRMYQTVYAKKCGSIAAPTAGLHFTNGLLAEMERKGAKTAFVTLHIGLGTFAPVKTEDISKHKPDAEYFEIDEKNARVINGAKRVIAVGTTVVKALESSCSDGKIMPTSGWSNLFIHPPYEFKADVEHLITNFHLPRSTLLMLVCAYAGRERIMEAYKTAIENSYRFYSLGDAMLASKLRKQI